MRFFAVKLEPCGQGTPQALDLRERFLHRRIAADVKRLPTGYPDFDQIAFFQVQQIDDFHWHPDCQTVSPLRKFHKIYMLIVYQRRFIQPAADFDDLVVGQAQRL